ncbi:MAG: ferrochelatase [Acidimicrobiales bacterium]
MTTGVVVMAYGTPATPDDVEAFYTDIRHGNPPSPVQLGDLERRYDAIGGVSPLAERTTAQVESLQRALEVSSPGHYLVRYGAKHSTPKIEQSVNALADDNVDAIVGIVLAPHYSAMSVGEYVSRARAQASARDVPSGFVERWGANPTLIGVLSERTLEAIRSIDRSVGDVEVIFTAHSLPARILDEGDPYAGELTETAALVAEAAELVRWRTGWQSAGRTSDEWLGPDILDELTNLAAEGAKSVVVCPAGFTSDHLEVCYDLDIEAKQRAEELGLAFARTASLNDDARIAAALARLVVAADPKPSRAT